ncbi:hypothetical protein CLF_107663 [Clonorchis sinensis]|uniref:Uncharacterized protein n=1 Tax=Clonorchis sinensis TaxID=79923 RepID=G7YQW9_CLOSI|nr:hypothetical protein CLF_107663 [Clonorchis sinensis]
MRKIKANSGSGTRARMGVLARTGLIVRTGALEDCRLRTNSILKNAQTNYWNKQVRFVAREAFRRDAHRIKQMVRRIQHERKLISHPQAHAFYLSRPMTPRQRLSEDVSVPMLAEATSDSHIKAAHNLDDTRLFQFRGRELRRLYVPDRHDFRQRLYEIQCSKDQRGVHLIISSLALMNRNGWISIIFGCHFYSGDPRQFLVYRTTSGEYEELIVSIVKFFVNRQAALKTDSATNFPRLFGQSNFPHEESSGLPDVSGRNKVGDDGAVSSASVLKPRFFAPYQCFLAVRLLEPSSLFQLQIYQGYLSELCTVDRTRQNLHNVARKANPSSAYPPTMEAISMSEPTSCSLFDSSGQLKNSVQNHINEQFHGSNPRTEDGKLGQGFPQIPSCVFTPIVPATYAEGQSSRILRLTKSRDVLWRGNVSFVSATNQSKNSRFKSDDPLPEELGMALSTGSLALLLNACQRLILIGLTVTLAMVGFLACLQLAKFLAQRLLPIRTRKHASLAYRSRHGQRYTLLVSSYKSEAPFQCFLPLVRNYKTTSPGQEEDRSKVSDVNGASDVSVARSIKHLSEKLEFRISEIFLLFFSSDTSKLPRHFQPVLFVFDEHLPILVHEMEPDKMKDSAIKASSKHSSDRVKDILCDEALSSHLNVTYSLALDCHTNGKPTPCSQYTAAQQQTHDQFGAVGKRLADKEHNSFIANKRVPKLQGALRYLLDDLDIDPACFIGVCVTLAMNVGTATGLQKRTYVKNNIKFDEKGYYGRETIILVYRCFLSFELENLMLFRAFWQQTFVLCESLLLDFGQTVHANLRKTAAK